MGVPTSEVGYTSEGGHAVALAKKALVNEKNSLKISQHKTNKT
jgi:hypothetical protein